MEEQKEYDTEPDSERDQTDADLLGRHVSIQIPFEAVPDDCIWIDGEITGVGGPLVQVTTDDSRVYYRHRDDVL